MIKLENNKMDIVLGQEDVFTSILADPDEKVITFGLRPKMELDEKESDSIIGGERAFLEMLDLIENYDCLMEIPLASAERLIEDLQQAVDFIKENGRV